MRQESVVSLSLFTKKMQLDFSCLISHKKSSLSNSYQSACEEDRHNASKHKEK